MIRLSRSFLSCLVVFAAGCGSKEPEQSEPPSCNAEAQTGCETGKVCEVVEGGKTGCFAPLEVEGRVIKAADGTTGIAGARVVARDVNGALASRNVAVSGADGVYRLTFPATRKADGTPSTGQFSLRADAAGYATFPSGLRVALPVDVAQPAKQPDGRYVIKNASTDIALDALPDAANLGSISGVVKPAGSGGTLVVAGAASGIAGPDGAYTIFNVTAGTHEVRGYLQGLQLKPASANVTAGAETKNVDLDADGAPLGSVNGDVSFVNAGTQNTSVVLVVKSTFNTTLARGEVPKGLRAANVTGKYAFERVPNGTYVVLAAFENDGLVRDPDTTIGGTAIQEVVVSGGAHSVPGFKITGALDVVAPGAAGPQPVTLPVDFQWKDDSSEDGYHVIVYDTFGKVVFENKDVARVTGSANVTFNFTQALTPGYYQFKALSWREKKTGGGGGRTYISSTEDLKGVFIIK